MFHYTPKKSIKKDLLRIRKTYAPNKEWSFIHGVIKNGPYEMYIAFANHWLETSFYSKTKLTGVPVNGVLFPVELFEVNEL